MKKLLVAIALTGFVAAAFGQGQVQFRNYNAGTASTINAPVYLDVVGGAKLNSSNTLWRTALIGGPSSGAVFAAVNAATSTFSEGNLVTLANNNTTSIAWVNFKSGTGNPPVADGYIFPGSAAARVVPGAAWGTQVAVQMVAWQGAFTTWADAFAHRLDAGVKIGVSNPLTLTLPLSVTDNNLTQLNGLASFAIVSVPEPATLALAGLGLASLLIFRRRN